MANSDKNILITPSVGISTNPTIKFNGANNTPTTLRVLDDGTVSFEGTAGQLFSVADGMTGTIFSVNDVSGIPNIEVLDTALVKLNQYQGQSVFGSSAAISNAAGNPAQVSIVPKNQITPGLIIKHAPENTATITNITGSGSAVTYTALNTFSAGTYVTITGANPSAYNLTNAYIGNATSTQFTVSNSATGTYVSGGTATTVGPSSLNPIFEIQSSSGSSIFSIETSSNNPTVKAFLFRANYFGAIDNTITIGSYAGTYEIMGSTAASTILKVTGATSQTANLQEWISSGGQSLTRVRSSGQFGIGSVITGTGLVVNLDILGAATNGIIIRGAASHTGDLFLLQASDGSILFRFNSQGQVQPLSTAGQAFTIKGVASQSLNLQEWQNSSGSILNSILPSGGLLLNRGNDSTGTQNITQLTFGYLSQTSQGSYKHWVRSRHNASTGVSNAIEFYTSDGAADGAFPANAIYGLGIENGSISTPKANINISSASNVGLIIKGAASQTANLQEWQDSSGTVLANMEAGGFLRLTREARIAQTNAGEKLLVLRGASSQTANLQEWQDSAANIWAHVGLSGSRFGAIGSQGATFIDQYGNLTVRSNSTVFGNSIVSIGTAGATSTGITIRSVASQTANLQEWQDSGGNILGFFNPYGTLTANNRIYGGWAAFGSGYGTAASASNVVLIAKGSASQTANLQEWQDSAGTVLSSISSAGLIRVNNTNTDAMITATGNSTYDAFRFRNAGGLFLWGGGSNNNIYYASTGTFALTGGNWASGRFAVDTGSTSSIGIIVRGVTSQTGNLQEWQNSSGQIRAKIDSYGGFSSLATTTISNDLNGTGTALVVQTRDAGGIPIVVKGFTSQTANLQEWQNSAGSVVANITASGGAAANFYNSTGGQFLLTYSQGGGNLRLLKSTATANAPGADTGVLYFRNGTTAGTLKLVVRAGESGAETTILDNIPQS